MLIPWRKAPKQDSDPAPAGPLFHTITHTPETHAEFPNEVIERNVRANRKLPLPDLFSLPEYGKYKNGEHIAIVAGGPSLNDTLDELRRFKTVMVCGTAHDHLIAQGIVPTYAALCDPNPACTHFLKNPQRETRYFVASSCDPSMFDHLSGYDVVRFNNVGGENLLVYEGQPCVAGGCTITLRALCIAILLGYVPDSEIHFFGFDSSFPSNELHHAYDHIGPNGLDMETNNRCIVRIGNQYGKKFLSTPAWVAQLVHFQEAIKEYGHLFAPVVHGDGMIAEAMRLGRVAALRAEHSPGGLANVRL